MRNTRSTRTLIIRTLGTVAVALAGVLGALAPAAAAPGSGDPPGANGTIKIDGLAYDPGTANEPHVTCEFRVTFANFDRDERANIVFSVQPPTSSPTVLLRRDGVLVSTDAAGGGKPDPDETFRFSAAELGLSAYPPHPRQGYHVKLTVERIGAPGAGKHKVFWVRPCAASTSSSGTAGGGIGGIGGGGGVSANGGAATLPVTGVRIGSIAVLGAGLLASGALLMAVRRRRTRFTA
jgi:LPXTG-motif cell wall-anchored protein